MKRAADGAGVHLVTGDTKVVDRGKGDGLYINTAGIGIVPAGLHVGPAAVRQGDRILLSGGLGRHGIAVMAVREGLAFESTVESDCAPLYTMVASLLEAGISVHCMRDLTRGGLASALVEIAETARLHFAINESAIPIDDGVRGACEILGLDPLYVANEGRFIAFVPEAEAARALALLQEHPQGAEARMIGSVQLEPPALVTRKSALGTKRILDMISGEQLPRIC
jgi:hydrogenase expression/formation protein HypE